MPYDLGIDVGTTFTAAAVVRDGHVEVVSLSTNQVAVPSVVFASGAEMLFDGEAVRRGAAQPVGLAREFKRRMGDTVPLMLSGSPYHADRLTALMARWVLDSVSEQFGEAPRNVVMTHPANWTRFQLELLRNALDGVGMRPTGLLSEPAAAALDYAAATNVEQGSLLLVYDLGGGTFDVALLRRDGTGFVHQVEPVGVERLGGIDFDEAVFQHVARSIPPVHLNNARSTPEGFVALASLRRACVDAKEALSSASAADIPVLLPGYTTTIRIARREFEDMIRPMVTQTVSVVENLLNMPDAQGLAVSAALLVGGSSRIPLIPQTVAEQLRLPVRVDAHPKLVVARGAARSAATLPAPVPLPPPKLPRRPGASRRRFAVLAAAPVLAAAAASGWVVTRSGDDAESVLTTLASAASEPTAPSTSQSSSTSQAPTTTELAAFRVVDTFATLNLPVDIELVGTDLWVSSLTEGVIQRYDVSTGTAAAVGDPLELGFIPEPGFWTGNDIVVNGDRLYVTQYDGLSVAVVDPVLPGLVSRVVLEGRPLNGTVMGDTVWVTVHSVETVPDSRLPVSGSLVAIRDGAVVDTIELPKPGWGVRAVGDELWVTFDSDDEFGIVDPASGEVEPFELAGEPVDVLDVGGDVWISLREGGRIAVVSAADRTIEYIDDVGLMPHKLARGGGSVWVTCQGDGTAPGKVVRLDPETHTRQQPDVTVGVNPFELAVSDDGVYLANSGEGTVAVLEP